MLSILILLIANNLYFLVSDMFAEFYQKGRYNYSLNVFNQEIGAGLLQTQLLIDPNDQKKLKDIINRIENNSSQHLWNIFEVKNNQNLKKFATILHLRCEQTDENHNIIHLIQKYHQVWDQHLLAIFEEGKQRGVLPKNLDSQLALLSLTATLHGLTVKWLSTTEPFDLQQYAPKLIDICFDNLKNSPFLRD